MNLKKSVKKILTGVLAIGMMATLWGCSGDSAPVELKEYTTPDGTASIQLNAAWETMDMGMDCWLAAVSAKNDEGMFLMQFPTSGANWLVDDMDQMISIVEESYQIANKAASADAEVPGMSDVKAYTCKMSDGQGSTLDAYLVYGQTDYACYTFAFLSEKMNDKKIAAFKEWCKTFKEDAPEEEDNSTVTMTDTVRWFNASYAILTEINGWDYTRFGGLALNDASAQLVQGILDNSWGVTDRASADETLDWILEEGHRAGFMEDMGYLEELGMDDNAKEDRADWLMENFDFTEEEAGYYADCYGFYEEFGDNAINGWDYCRALNLLSFYSTAGYYTEEEALDASLEIAQMVQPLFGSWDELIASYMRGYEYWAEESSADRQAIYEDLKTRNDNPFAVDFKTNLTKTW